LDSGGGPLFALRYQLPLLTAYGPSRLGTGVAVRLPEQLGLSAQPDLDRTLTMLVARLLAGAAPEQDQAVRALGGLHRTHALQAFLLPDVASGASRLLMAYAHDRGKRVGVLRPGTYELHELDDADGLAEVASTWSEHEAGAGWSENEAGAERIHDWPGGFDAGRFTGALTALAA
jgi:hypothetical protein